MPYPTPSPAAGYAAALVTVCMLGANPSLAATGSGANLTLDRIHGAIEKAVKAYYEKVDPPWTFDRMWLLDKKRYYNNWRVEHAMGNHALMIWGMLACGESYQHPELHRRINWVLSLDYPFTYDRSMRLQMLAQLPPARWRPLVRRDVLALSKSLTLPDEGTQTPGGAFTAQYTSGMAIGWGDAANTQFGALGLAAAERADIRVKTDIWKMIDRYWRVTQHKPSESESARDKRRGFVQPAAWSVVPLTTDVTNVQAKGSEPFYRKVSGAMTAGAVSTLCITERQLRGPKMKSGDKLSLELRRGIAWLDTNFSTENRDVYTDWDLYMYSIQNVGRATGYRTFNGTNWFREVTTELLARQKSNGLWTGPKGDLLSTGFALLYLARANDPVAISKLRWQVPLESSGDAAEAGDIAEGVWNNRPHDIWNFVEYAADQYEAGTTWQIVELSQPVHELIESPLLYLATNEPFRFSDAEIDNLHAYVEAGGLLIVNPEGTNAGPVVRSIRELAQRMFGEHEWTDVPRTHAFYNLHQTVGPRLQMRMIDNGIRPLVVHMQRDIGEGLQKNDTQTDGFKVLSNLYLYVSGMNPRRRRLHSSYVVQRYDEPSKKLPAARIKHRGVFDPEPHALRQLKALLANDHDIYLQYDPKGIEATALDDQKLAFLTTMGDGSIDEHDAKALRQWVTAGGTLWIDAAGGTAEGSRTVQAIARSIMPGSIPVRLPPEHPIMAGSIRPGEKRNDNAALHYRLYTLRSMGPTRHIRLMAHLVDGRAAVVYSMEDVTCGLAGLNHWRIFGYEPHTARHLVVNGALVALRG